MPKYQYNIKEEKQNIHTQNQKKKKNIKESPHPPITPTPSLHSHHPIPAPSTHRDTYTSNTSLKQLNLINNQERKTKQPTLPNKNKLNKLIYYQQLTGLNYQNNWHKITGRKSSDFYKINRKIRPLPVYSISFGL